MVIAIVFLELGMAWVSALVLIGFALYAFFSGASAVFSGTKNAFSRLSTGVKEEVENAPGSHPPDKTWIEAGHEMGKRTGEMAAPDSHRLTMRDVGKKISKAAKKLSDSFKKMFGV